MATNMGRKFYVSPTPQPNEMEQTDYEALDDWVEIRLVTEVSESGVATNVLSMPVMDTKMLSKGKGITDAGDQTLTCKYDGDDAGQILMTELAQTPFYYAYKSVWNDAKTTAGEGTTKYDRGLALGPIQSGGGPEDFHTQTFTCAFEDWPVIIPAT